MRASLILLFGKTKAFFGKDTARKRTAFLHTLFVENERETSKLKWGAMFFYKVEGHMPKLSSFGRGKKFRPKKSLTSLLHAALQLFGSNNELHSTTTTSYFPLISSYKTLHRRHLKSGASPWGLLLTPLPTPSSPLPTHTYIYTLKSFQFSFMLSFKKFGTLFPWGCMDNSWNHTIFIYRVYDSPIILAVN